VRALAEENGADFISKRRSSLFWRLFVMGDQHLPATVVVGAIDRRLVRETCREVRQRIAERFEQPEASSTAQLFLLLHLAGSEARDFERSIPTLLRHCWRLGVYNLQLEVLHRVMLWGGRSSLDDQMSGDVRDEIVGALSEFETSNVFLSTQLVETMM